MSGSDDAALLAALPYARRFARALAGTREQGDAIVAAALRGGVAARPGANGARLGLFAAVARAAADAAPEPAAGSLTREGRMLLLLTALEDVTLEDAAAVLGLPAPRARAILDAARERLRAAHAARVLIIEDEPIIAMDLRQLVEGAGHRVVGVAASEDAAVAIAEHEQPGLVLADVNLGAGGDGAAAVARIMARHAVPVIFVTAYPERLLTGLGVEPAFVIPKPFEPTTLAVATFQAVMRGAPLDVG
jgi:CheY-like chemotaxis protein/DNA-directed RNA polymerase specialized sigma24 family protein